ncbi:DEOXYURIDINE 5'-TRIPHOSPHATE NUCLEOTIDOHYDROLASE-LIKE [Salix purpurea]|uniref:dUTP diphosphatase n=1 Tax=Salix purpurea TaxID=77065 RepID=A0A9Q0SS12_SALPP|nr:DEOXYURIDINE 5'-TRIPHOSPHATE NUCLEOTIDOHYDROLASE-LIKE [Salix purpurea]
MHDQKKKDVFRPSLLDMETGRRDRWRDEERDTNSSLRKDRWRDGDKELGDSLRMDRWPENSSLFRVKRLSENVVLPSRGSPLSAGCDLSSVSAAKVPARGIALIPTDLSIAIPEGTYARIAPRSGLTWKHSIDVGAGVIDADYRGPVGVILFNHSDLNFEVKVGYKIAHLIIQKIVTPNAIEVEDLDATVRGAGGFGNSFRVKRLSENAVFPSRGSPLSAGYDLSSVSAAKLGFVDLAPRSGLTWKHSIDVGAGVIHADYQGPVGVILFNHSDVDFEVKVGDKIAQLIIEMIVTPNGVEAEDLDATVRGAGGCGNSFRVKRLSENVVLPSRGSPLSASCDLSSTSAAKVPARGKAIIPTDLSIAVPEGTYARIAPRSGLTWKHSIDVGDGVINADYRGPVRVILVNHSDVDFEVKVGDKIAQLILQKIMTPNAMEVEDLDATVRGAGGFGSTGVRA